MRKSNNHYDLRVETYLAAADNDRFMSLCKRNHKSKSAIARAALLRYVETEEEAKSIKREDEISKSIKNLTDRICGMLARQGAQTGTLFELNWQNHVENKIEQRFIAATNTVKQRMRKRLEEDERILADRMRKVVSE
jgi:hypothetical protein